MLKRPRASDRAATGSRSMWTKLSDCSANSYPDIESTRFKNAASTSCRRARAILHDTPWLVQFHRPHALEAQNVMADSSHAQLLMPLRSATTIAELRRDLLSSPTQEPVAEVFARRARPFRACAALQTLEKEPLSPQLCALPRLKMTRAFFGVMTLALRWLRPVTTSGSSSWKPGFGACAPESIPTALCPQWRRSRVASAGRTSRT